MTPRKGARIRLTAPLDCGMDQLPCGAEGVVVAVNSSPGHVQFNVRWDDGPTLVLIQGVDFYETLPTQEARNG